MPLTKPSRSSGTRETKAYEMTSIDLTGVMANASYQRQWKDIRHKYVEAEE